MFEFFVVLILGTSIWVYFDARSIGVRQGQISGIGDQSPLGWFLVCILLWIVGFPLYLATRPKLKLINQQFGDRPQASPVQQESVAPPVPTVIANAAANGPNALLVLFLLGLVGVVFVGIFLYNPGANPGMGNLLSLTPIVTKAEFSALSEGMTYRQAAAIIGTDGEEISRVELAGTSTVMYQWQNSDASNMNAMFQDGRLVSKAQFGLR